MSPRFLFFKGSSFSVAKSIDLNGTDEYLLNNTAQSIGIANTWSINVWAKLPSIPTNTPVLFSCQTNSTNNQILIFLDGATTGDPVEIIIRNNGATVFKDYEMRSVVTANQWFMATFTWDGTNLTTYFDGSVKTPTKVTDNASSQIDSNRRISVGTRAINTPDLFWPGLVHSVAIWDVELTSSEVTSIYNSGGGSAFDLRTDSGNYASSANLIHYWIPGFNESDIGGDLGTGTAIDIDVNASNITAADDLVTDVPT